MSFGSSSLSLLRSHVKTALVLGTLSLLVPRLSQAQAEPNPQPSLQEARSAFLEGMELLNEEEWEAARARFAFAAGARRTPGLLYYQAYCLEQQARYLEALALYQEAQDLIDQVSAADVEALLPEAIARADAALASLQFPQLPQDSRISIDHEQRPTISALRLDPGVHHVAIEAPGYDRFETEVTLAAGDEHLVDVELQKRKSEPASPDSIVSSTQRETKRGPGAKPYVVGAATAIGLTGLGVGIFYTVRHQNHRKQSIALREEVDRVSEDDSSGCASENPMLVAPCSELADSTAQERNAQTMMIVGYSVFGVGALLAVSAQILWKSPSVEVAPIAGGATLSWSGAF